MLWHGCGAEMSVQGRCASVAGMADAGLLKRICAEDKEALDLIDQVEQAKHGGDRKSEHIKSDVITLDTNQRGTSRQHALRKLRKDRPDLHARGRDVFGF